MTSYSSSSARGLQLVFGLFCGGHLGGYASGQARLKITCARSGTQSCQGDGVHPNAINVVIQPAGCDSGSLRNPARLGGIDGQVSEAIGLVAVPPVLLGTGTASGRRTGWTREIWQVIDRTITVSEPEKTPASESQ